MNRGFLLGVVVASIVWLLVFSINQRYFHPVQIIYSTVNSTALYESGFIEPSDNHTPIEIDHYEYYDDGYHKGFISIPVH